MATTPRVLRVCTNPFRSTDPQGRPCHVVQLDPMDPRYPRDARGWRGEVGSRILSAEEVRPAPAGRDKDGHELTLQAARHDRVWGFRREPLELPLTDYYRRAVRDGDLLAADEESARLCGVPFADPEVVRFETQRATGASDAEWLDAPAPLDSAG
jgi:hypothetical protein